MEFNKKVIANRIKSLRLENKMTQETLASLLGLKGKSSIANYESGKIIPSDKIKLKLCDIFNCPIEYLMGMSDNRFDYDYDEWSKKTKENNRKSSSLLKNNYDEDEKEFRFAFHKETEGMTNEEIKDALRFYKEMKKKIKGDQ